MLRENDSVKVLNLRDNLDEAGASRIAAALAVNQGITDLRLSYNRIGMGGLQALGQALRQNPRVTSLNLGGCKIGDAGMHEVVGLLEHNDTLRMLNLSNNDITPKGAILLLNALREKPLFTALTLGWFNSIGAEGAHAMGELLATHTGLASLDLSACDIDSDGAIAIAQGLYDNITLEHLRLRHNAKLKAEGVLALAGALQTHPAIKSVDLSGIPLDLATVEALAQMLLNNHPSLVSLDLSECGIDDAGASILAKALAQNKTLKKLALNNNKIGNEGACELIGALENQQRTIILKMNGNGGIDAGTGAALLKLCAEEAVKFET
jgi:Ran GTPase-activating protein (RanGAP) involved in mRNA processing and transport